MGGGRGGKERKTKPGSRRLQTIRALFDLSSLS